MIYNVDKMAETLGSFEQAVLLAIVRLGDGAYGRAILSDVSERLRRDVSVGAVHATLERLEAKGMVRSWMGEGTAVRGGRAKRYFQVRPAGIAALNETRAAMIGLWHGLAWPLETRS
jgi:PadR family transcriptional regulator PadR